MYQLYNWENIHFRFYTLIALYKYSIVLSNVGFFYKIFSRFVLKSIINMHKRKESLLILIFEALKIEFHNFGDFER